MQTVRNRSKWTHQWQALIIVALIMLLLVGCGGDDEAAAEAAPTPEVTAASGGIVVATATPAPIAPPTQAPATPSPWTVGAKVRVTQEAGARIYADAKLSAQVMNAYPKDALLEVLDPSGDYAAYPVQQDEQEWYRVRADDGLVGWAKAGDLAVVE